MIEFKQGRKKFFLRESNGVYFLEKITKGCGFTVYATDNAEEMANYLKANNYKKA